MARRSGRVIDHETTSRLLQAVGACREATTALSATAPIGGPEYLAADKLRSALDDMAGTLTGNREYFWLKGHSTSGGA